LTKKDEIIAYDLVTDKLSWHFGDSNIVSSLKSDFGGARSVNFVDGKLFYFNGSAVFVETELIMKCQSAAVVWHRPKSSSPSLVNITGAVQEGSRLAVKSIIF